MSDKQKQMARGLTSSLVRETEVSAFSVEHSTLGEAKDASAVPPRQPPAGWVEGGLIIPPDLSQTRILEKLAKQF